MCGIFAFLNYQEAHYSHAEVSAGFEKGRGRGPENSQLHFEWPECVVGFHRLAINGLNEGSNQPITIGGITLICNGEIYNYKELYVASQSQHNTDSDCEVIIHMYRKYGIEQTLQMLDGVFAFLLFDLRDPTLPVAFAARDPFGVRPLYSVVNSFAGSSAEGAQQARSRRTEFGFGSELKVLDWMVADGPSGAAVTVNQFAPGTYSRFTLATTAASAQEEAGATTVLREWRTTVTDTNRRYFIPNFSNYLYPKLEHLGEDSDHLADVDDSVLDYQHRVVRRLKKAVFKRCEATERPIACLLSGGVDSSLITALVNLYYKSVGKAEPLETYSIGLKDASDLAFAREVAAHLGSKHTEIIVTEDEMFAAIPEVIYAIESFDTTTVRASIGNYLIGKYIAAHSDAKVIFNGDGSDELCGGYLYFKLCPDEVEFDKETRRLLQDIHMFDVLRSDKSISSHGLEPRTPFLDKNFVNSYLSIPAHIRFESQKFVSRESLGLQSEKKASPTLTQQQKWLLRTSFQLFCPNLLPETVLFREKEAFSDGVSVMGRSLYVILQERIGALYGLPPSIDLEKRYYSEIFAKHYPHTGAGKTDGILPYLWMPRYTSATDPSARTLTIYAKE